MKTFRVTYFRENLLRKTTLIAESKSDVRFLIQFTIVDIVELNEVGAVIA